MKKIFLLIILFVTINIYCHEFYFDSTVSQGYPLTLIISPVTESFDYTFSLINSNKKEILNFKGFYYYLEEIQTPIILGLAGIPSNLPPGTYRLTAKGRGRSSSYFFDRSITVLEVDYTKIEFIGNDKMDNIVNGEITEERENQSLRLWDAISGFSPYSIYEEGLLIQPVEGRHTSPFGFLRVTSYSHGESSISVHSGEDLANKIGTPVLSDGRGVVILAEERVVTGNTVVVEHLPGVKTLYYHMNSIDVKRGDLIVKGEKIGEIGTTGFSTGPHLHWEIRISTVSVNPSYFIDTPLIDKKHIMNIINTTNNKKGGVISIANIRVHDDELLEKALKRFKRLVEKEGIVREYKRREYFEKPSTINHRKKKALVRKQAKKLRKIQGSKNY